MATRKEHIDWAKQRALEYVDMGNLPAALASIVSDLGKHDETRNHHGIELTNRLMASGFLSSAADVRKHIEGFQ